MKSISMRSITMKAAMTHRRALGSHLPSKLPSPRLFWQTDIWNLVSPILIDLHWKSKQKNKKKHFQHRVSFLPIWHSAPQNAPSSFASVSEISMSKPWRNDEKLDTKTVEIKTTGSNILTWFISKLLESWRLMNMARGWFQYCLNYFWTLCHLSATTGQVQCWAGWERDQVRKQQVRLDDYLIMHTSSRQYYGGKVISACVRVYSQSRHTPDGRVGHWSPRPKYTSLIRWWLVNPR